MKLAFYTCFYGSNNNNAFLIPKIPSLKYPCYYISNNKKMLDILEKNTHWIALYDEIKISEDEVESCMAGKIIKVRPHGFSFLNEYDYLCFLDSKLEYVSETFVEEYIQKFFIEQNYAILLRTQDGMPNSVWIEFIKAMEQERYILQCERYVRYINKQKERGLEESNISQSFIRCGFIIRNMKHEKTKELCDTWFNHIQECGIEDQISFFFVRQLYSEYIHAFSETPFIPYKPLNN